MKTLSFAFAALLTAGLSTSAFAQTTPGTGTMQTTPRTGTMQTNPNNTGTMRDGTMRDGTMHDGSMNSNDNMRNGTTTGRHSMKSKGNMMHGKGKMKAKSSK